MNASNPSTLSAPRERLLVDAGAVIEALPRIGNLMITAKQSGTTHERIGTVESVAFAEGWVACTGAAHHSRIDSGRIHSVIVDRTSIMQEQVYPRIDFLDQGDGVIVSVVGFGGLEPFDAALAAFDRVPLPPASLDPPGERPEVAVDDPGRLPFERALAAGADISIELTKPGFEQSWSGRLTSVKPARGFINIMHPDFHLHVRAGSVAQWRDVPDASVPTLEAIAPDGSGIGLVLRGLTATAEREP